MELVILFLCAIAPTGLAVYGGYWLYRGGRRAWSHISGRPAPSPKPILSPRWVKAFHIAGVILSVAVLAWYAVMVLALMAFANR